MEERLEAARELCAPHANVSVDSSKACWSTTPSGRRARDRSWATRGHDFEYELQIAHANAELRPEIDTVFLPTRTNYGFISASFVREIGVTGVI